jgi:LCP family protein required for cell wall assembly
MTVTDPSVPARPRRRRSRSPLPWIVSIAGVIGVVGAAGVLRAADERTADVERIDGLESVLANVPDENDSSIEYPAENYLLVGSDTREGVDPNSPDFGALGSEAEVGTSRRSDTIMVLRQERNGGAALMNLPRDLWLPIAGTDTSQRINTAYNDGPERLAATVTESLGIPIHHYVEVDFVGFKDIIDDLGGVEVCVEYGARDANSGLQINPGCQVLDGVQALAFARSRYYEQWDGTSWVVDPRADLGRIERQQLFMRAAVDGVLRKLQASPFGSGDVIAAVVDSVRIDDRLDPIKAGEALRQAAEAGLRTYSLPVVNDTVGDAAILRLGDGADEVLAYFRGEAAAPVEYETGVTTSASDVATAGAVVPPTVAGG